MRLRCAEFVQQLAAATRRAVFETTAAHSEWSYHRPLRRAYRELRVAVHPRVRTVAAVTGCGSWCVPTYAASKSFFFHSLFEQRFPGALVVGFTLVRVGGISGVMLSQDSVLSKWFVRRLGSVVAWQRCVQAVFAITLIPMFVGAAVPSIGWRSTLVVLAMPLLLAVPLAVPLLLPTPARHTFGLVMFSLLFPKLCELFAPAGMRWAEARRRGGGAGGGRGGGRALVLSR